MHKCSINGQFFKNSVWWQSTHDRFSYILCLIWLSSWLSQSVKSIDRELNNISKLHHVSFLFDKIYQEAGQSVRKNLVWRQRSQIVRNETLLVLQCVQGSRLRKTRVNPWLWILVLLLGFAKGHTSGQFRRFELRFEPRIFGVINQVLLLLISFWAFLFTKLYQARIFVNTSKISMQILRSLLETRFVWLLECWLCLFIIRAVVILDDSLRVFKGFISFTANKGTHMISSNSRSPIEWFKTWLCFVGIMTIVKTPSFCPCALVGII